MSGVPLDHWLATIVSPSRSVIFASVSRTPFGQWGGRLQPEGAGPPGADHLLSLSERDRKGFSRPTTQRPDIQFVRHLHTNAWNKQYCGRGRWWRRRWWWHARVFKRSGNWRRRRRSRRVLQDSTNQWIQRYLCDNRCRWCGRIRRNWRQRWHYQLWWVRHRRRRLRRKRGSGFLSIPATERLWHWRRYSHRRQYQQWGRRLRRQSNDRHFQQWYQRKRGRLGLRRRR